MARRPVTKQQRRALALVADMEPVIRDAFTKAIQAARGAINEADLIAAIEARDIARALDALRIEQGMLFALDDAIRAAYIAGGTSIAADLPKGISGAFGFDGRHPRAEAWTRARGSELIQGIQQDTLAMARDVIEEGLIEGRSSRRIATDIVGKKVGATRQGGFIGLTEQQGATIQRSRAALTAGDIDGMKSYLGLKQRDTRFDGIVKRAIKAGKSVSAEDVAKISAAHKSKALGYRGKVIAKNESHSALAAGRDEAYQQVLDKPGVDAVTIRWQHNLSSNPREDHVAMDGTVIRLGEAFDFGGILMKHPHDPAGGAEHSIGCRCVGVYRVELERD